MAEPTDPKKALSQTDKILGGLNPEEIEKTRQLLDDLGLKMDAVSEATAAAAESQEKLNKAMKDAKGITKNVAGLEKDLADAKQKLSDAQKLNLVKLAETFEHKIKTIEANIKEKKTVEDLTEAQKELNDTLKESEKDLADTSEELKEFGFNVEKVKKDLPGVKKSVEEVSKSVNTIQGALGKSLGTGGGFLGEIYRSVTSASKAMSQLGAAANNVGGYTKVLTNSLAKANKGFAKIGGLAGAFAIGLVVQLGKMALGVNNLSKQLAKATGFGDKFNEEIVEIAKQGNMAGIGFQQSADALGALTQGLSSFNPNAEETNVHLGLTVARLKELGVDSATATKSIDHMQRAMGMTAEQAADTTAQLARMGKEIGITGVKMINDFNAASSRLAIYGDRNIEVFKGMAAMAKASGIEIQNLISISKQFDQFDEATKKVASLNAVLGTQLSTLELMAVDGPERIMLIKQQVQASVGNFDSLDKFTKQYIAQAMGVASVDEAQRLLNMSTAEYQKYQQGQQEQADIQKELAKATEEVVPFMQQLKMAGLELLMAFSPLIKLFAQIVSGLSVFIAPFARFVAAVAPTVVLLTAIAVKIGAIGGSIAGMLTPVGWAIAAIVALVGVFGQLFDIIHKPGSRSMAEGMFDKDLGPTFAKMGKDASGARGELSALSEEMSNVYDAAHPDGKAMDIQAAASIDTSAIASGLEKVKSVLMELSTVKIDGFLAMTTDGTSSSFIMGSEGLIKSISEGKLTVDVKMPEMKMPDLNVKVYIGDRELRDIIRTEVSSVVGAAG